MTGKRTALAALALWACVGAPASAQDVKSLLERMTLEEKAGQLSMAARLGTNPLRDRDAPRKDMIGSVLNVITPQERATVTDAVAGSRLKIPTLFAYDIIHGHKTLFPVPLAEAASFDPDMAARSSEFAAREARAHGLALTFAPFADLSRDARWGRIIEGSGEDPLLNALFAKARVEGFRRGGIASTVKHFAGYGAVEGGRDYGPVDLPVTELRNRYLSGYKAAIEAGADTVMMSFVALNGVPSAVNRFLIHDLLRGEWGFKGAIMSDLEAVHELVEMGVATDDRDAVVQAFNAGVDIDMESGLYQRYLPELVREGRVSEADLNAAVARVLTLKARLGLFGEAPIDFEAAKRASATPDMLAFARASAAQTMVLLKNERDILPLKSGLRSLAVIGSLGNSPATVLGPQFAASDEKDTLSLLVGLRERAEPAGITVRYAEGCDIECDTTTGFAEATRLASESDAAIIVVGEPRHSTSEAGSRTRLELPGHQEDLVKAVAASGKPVILVVFAGRAPALSNVLPASTAILNIWYPGSEGAHALADVLLGEAEPSGRLPITLPRSTGQVPLTYNQYAVGRPGDEAQFFSNRYYREPPGPLFPFGFGLGYGKVRYGTVALENTTPGPQDKVTAHVALTNEGAHQTLETVQLYVRQKVAKRTRPLRELKAFTRITLKPGETRTLDLSAAIADFGYWQEDGRYVVEPGAYQIFVGRDSTAPLAGEINVREGLERSVDMAQR